MTSQDSPSLCQVFFSVFALLNLRLHRCVKLLILASSSLRVLSSDHSLPRRRRTVVILPHSASTIPHTPPRSANPSPYHTTTSHITELSSIISSVVVCFVARLVEFL